MKFTQGGSTVRKVTVQSEVDKPRVDTARSTNKSGLDTTNGTSAIPLTSQKNSGEDDANSSPAGTSPPSTSNHPPVLLSPSDDSNVRLREPLLED